MRQDLKDRQHLSLSRRLEEISTKRRILVLQLAELDAQGKAVQQELHNLDSPISILPSDILAMIFETGALLEASAEFHFGSLVSHVSQSWREIALETPRLWNKIEYTKSADMEDDPYSEKVRSRATTFLTRSKSSPVDIQIQDYFYESDQDDVQTKNFLAMLGDQVGHFYRLCIKDGDPDGVRDILQYLSHKPASILHSILLGNYGVLELKGPLFPLGAPHLTIAQLDGIATSSLQYCLPSFQHLRCLRLAGIEIDGQGFRDALIALPVLTHLELSVVGSSQDATSFPVVLPTVRFLQVETYGADHLDRVIRIIHATSLTALSLLGWDYDVPGLNLALQDLEPHFPALQHLILGGITNQAPDLEVVASRFPGIERLTCQISQKKGLCGIDHILATIDTGSSGDSLRWPKLHTVAVSGSGIPLDVGALHYKISMMRDAGHPLRSLKLRKSLLIEAGAKAMGHLRQIVDVEDFSLDWPTPFAGLDN
ncbi:hypothetical protein FIBSPDRAFT_152179 [Athelia psychrophila]|uniref:Uncharacterized protein n=1 Tax=Athelia psychrophila TaxID=1759441 RepID=A0A166BJL0_9AGAM|nr:hypothetical protein FIBSPDRAFT_152179 [Fibularhizoctonia sp. CBS 109695]